MNAMQLNDMQDTVSFDMDVPEMVLEDVVQQLIAKEEYKIFAESVYFDTQGDIYVEGQRVY